MKNKLYNLLIPLFFVGLYFVVSYFDGSVNYFDLALFAFGVTSGVALMAMDEKVLHQYYLDSGAKKMNLMTRSLLFIISLFPLGLFIVSSTGSKIGVGILLGIVTVIFLELAKYSQDSETFHSRFMFQLKRKLTEQEMDYFVAGFGIYSLILILLTFFLGR